MEIPSIFWRHNNPPTIRNARKLLHSIPPWQFSSAGWLNKSRYWRWTHHGFPCDAGWSAATRIRRWVVENVDAGCHLEVHIYIYIYEYMWLSLCNIINMICIYHVISRHILPMRLPAYLHPMEVAMARLPGPAWNAVIDCRGPGDPGGEYMWKDVSYMPIPEK